jgi:hypothetical protein
MRRGFITGSMLPGARNNDPTLVANRVEDLVDDLSRGDFRERSKL